MCVCDKRFLFSRRGCKHIRDENDVANRLLSQLVWRPWGANYRVGDWQWIFVRQEIYLCVMCVIRKKNHFPTSLKHNLLSTLSKYFKFIKGGGFLLEFLFECHQRWWSLVVCVNPHPWHFLTNKRTKPRPVCSNIAQYFHVNLQWGQPFFFSRQLERNHIYIFVCLFVSVGYVVKTLQIFCNFLDDFEIFNFLEIDF